MSASPPLPPPLALEAEAVGVTFGEGATRVEALRGVSLAVPRGRLVAIMGASGSGKSTLLHLLAGLLRPTAGRVRVDGQDLGALDDDGLTRLRRRRIGLVFQAFHLLGVLTARENVALPLLLEGLPRATALPRADGVLAEVGLAARAEHLPSALSGGEQQRVAIARALVAEPALLLADEPTGNLDSARGAEILGLLRDLVKRRGRTLVMVTHDERAAAVADEVVRLADGRRVDPAPPGSAPAALP